MEQGSKGLPLQVTCVVDFCGQCLILSKIAFTADDEPWHSHCESLTHQNGVQEQDKVLPLYGKLATACGLLPQLHGLHDTIMMTHTPAHMHRH